MLSQILDNKEVCKWSRITSGFVALHPQASAPVKISRHYFKALYEYRAGNMWKCTDRLIKGSLCWYSTPVYRCYKISVSVMTLAWQTYHTKNTRKSWKTIAVTVVSIHLSATYPKVGKWVMLTYRIASRVYYAHYKQREPIEQASIIVQGAAKIYLSYLK